MIKEMLILKALRQLIAPQFIKPEWIRWLRDPECGWEFHPDGFMQERALAIDFNGAGGVVIVHIINELVKSSEINHDIPWSDPECDTKVVKLLKDWFVMIWKDAYLDKDYPNPAIGGVCSS